MIVPRHWAEGRAQRKVPGRQLTARRFGWSNDSAEAAQKMADNRAVDALERLWNGEKIPKREIKAAYNGFQGLPIREEILAEHGDTIITRNSYGAHCLNTPDVLFADVDFENCGKVSIPCFVEILFIVASIFLGWAYGSWLGGFVGFLVSLGLISLTAATLTRINLIKNGGKQGFALNAIAQFSDDHPDWGLRVYRTPLGLRIAATHRFFSPRAPEVETFFKAIGTDPMYQRMCQLQNCFRARLTGKPWRMGITSHLRPRPGVWPIKDIHLPKRNKWIKSYEKASQNFASCRLLTTFQESNQDAQVMEIITLHDKLSRSSSELDLA